MDAVRPDWYGQVIRTTLKAQGSRLKAQGSRLKAQGSVGMAQ
jgi:hypothetical protein